MMGLCVFAQRRGMNHMFYMSMMIAHCVLERMTNNESQSTFLTRRLDIGGVASRSKPLLLVVITGS